MTLTIGKMTLATEEMTLTIKLMTLTTETHREYHCWERRSSFGVDHSEELRQMSLPCSGKHQSERTKESPGVRSTNHDLFQATRLTVRS